MCGTYELQKISAYWLLIYLKRKIRQTISQSIYRGGLECSHMNLASGEITDRKQLRGGCRYQVFAEPLDGLHGSNEVTTRLFYSAVIHFMIAPPSASLCLLNKLVCHNEFLSFFFFFW
jgi:hypothetical protein